MTHLHPVGISKDHYFRSMESVVLDKGRVHLLEDHMWIEEDDALKRKRKNMLIYGGFLVLLLAYMFSIYRHYEEEPHSFNMFLSVIKILLFLILIVPNAITNVVRFSTANEIPYASIKKIEPAGTWSKWNRAIKLYLRDNEIRTLWFKDDEMARFSYFLNQKLKNNNS